MYGNIKLNPWELNKSYVSFLCFLRGIYTNAENVRRTRADPARGFHSHGRGAYSSA